MIRQNTLLSLSMENAKGLALFSLNKAMTSNAHPRELATSYMGLIQLDFVSRVLPSHWLTFWSRNHSLSYESVEMFYKEYDDFFEYELHEASVTKNMYFEKIAPLILSRNRTLKRSHQKKLGDNPENVLSSVLKYVQENGEVCGGDINIWMGEKKKRDGWWNRSVGRTALDALWYRGELRISRRHGMIAYYDLPRPEEQQILNCNRLFLKDTHQWMLLESLKYLGIACIDDICDYFRINKNIMQPVLQSGIDSGAVVEVSVKHSESKWFGRRDTLEEYFEYGVKKNSLHTLLTPFDEVIWSRKRLSKLFNFDYRNTMYTPKNKRISEGLGYYVMPFLYGDSFVGRIDVRVDRPSKTIVVEKISMEKNFHGDEYVNSLHSDIQSLAKFCKCVDVVGL